VSDALGMYTDWSLAVGQLRSRIGGLGSNKFRSRSGTQRLLPVHDISPIPADSATPLTDNTFQRPDRSQPLRYASDPAVSRAVRLAHHRAFR